jgi:predicted amidophosphoribosyltransferase
MEGIPVVVYIIGGVCGFFGFMAAVAAFLIWMLSSRKKPTCPECGASNPAGNKFCEQCGSALEQSQ